MGSPLITVVVIVGIAIVIFLALKDWLHKGDKDKTIEELAKERGEIIIDSDVEVRCRKALS